MGTILEKTGAWFNVSGVAGALRMATRYGAAMVMLLFGGAAVAAQGPMPLMGGATVASPQAKALAAKLKITKFNAQGTGSLTSTAAGTCFGETCNASKGLCECDVYSGTVKAPILGQSTWTVSYTINDNDDTPTGNGGVCFPAEGELVISSSKGTIAAEVSGPECENLLSGATTANVFQYGQAFKIDPTLSTGSTAGLNGGGSFSLTLDILNGLFVTMTADGFSAK